MFKTREKEEKKNNMKDLKAYLEKHKEINKYVTEIGYGFNTQLNLYKNDPKKVVRVNPTTVLDTVGFGASGVSSVYSQFLTSYDVFYELFNNEDIVKRQYSVVEGHWPQKYNEVVVEVNKNNEISDYTLYSLGLLDQDELREQFINMTSGKEVKFESHEYTKEEILNLSFKLVLNTDYYQKENGIWVDKSSDEKYMKKIIANAEEIKVVGIIKRNPDAIGGDYSYGLVGYKGELMTHLVEKVNNSQIAKEQLAKPEINVFTGASFQTKKTFDINSLTTEQKMALASMSQEDLAAYIKSYTENMSSSYEENLRKLGIASLDNPDSISIYPKDFDSKEEIVRIIDEYNKDKDDSDKIEYTDVVGLMMKSVTKIVNVISSVLIAFVAISLIVSSIMIAIITYISVIERTKEIGILRAIGASKKDISRVFNAETLIEGLAAGVFGIVATILINIPINLIIQHTLSIKNIAVLPLNGAVILILISIILTVIAGFIPAKIASKKDPVEALRTE